MAQQIKDTKMSVSYDEESNVYLELEKDGETLEIIMTIEDTVGMIEGLMDALNEAYSLKYNKPRLPLS